MNEFRLKCVNGWPFMWSVEKQKYELQWNSYFYNVLSQHIVLVPTNVFVAYDTDTSNPESWFIDKDVFLGKMNEQAKGFLEFFLT